MLFKWFKKGKRNFYGANEKYMETSTQKTKWTNDISCC